MRSFWWGLILTVFLLVPLINFATSTLQTKQAIRVLPVHKTLYLDRNIDDNRMLHILQATMEWNQATNGQVIFDIKRLPQPRVPANNVIVILDVSPDFPDILLLDNGTGFHALGYYNATASSIEFIELVHGRLNESTLTPVVLHELGHALGLKHTNEVGTLMFPSIEESASHITSSDLRQFCNIYHCDPSKFHGEP